MENTTSGLSVALNNAIGELNLVKSVSEWNEVRAKHIDTLTKEELAYLDGCGLIVKVLGSGK